MIKSENYTIVSSETPMPERTEEPTSLKVSDTILEALPADSAITTAVRERMTASETAQAHPSVVEQTKAGIDPLPVRRRSERTRQTPAYLRLRLCEIVVRSLKSEQE